MHLWRTVPGDITYTNMRAEHWRWAFRNYHCIAGLILFLYMNAPLTMPKHFKCKLAPRTDKNIRHSNFTNFSNLITRKLFKFIVLLSEIGRLYFYQERRKFPAPLSHNPPTQYSSYPNLIFWSLSVHHNNRTKLVPVRTGFLRVPFQPICSDTFVLIHTN